MKKLFHLSLTMLMTVSLWACSSAPAADNTDADAGKEQTASQPAEKEDTSAVQTPQEPAQPEYYGIYEPVSFVIEGTVPDEEQTAQIIQSLKDQGSWFQLSLGDECYFVREEKENIPFTLDWEGGRIIESGDESHFTVEDGKIKVESTEDVIIIFDKVGG